MCGYGPYASTGGRFAVCELAGILDLRPVMQHLNRVCEALPGEQARQHGLQRECTDHFFIAIMEHDVSQPERQENVSC